MVADLRADVADGRGFLWIVVAYGVGAALYFSLPVEPGAATILALALPLPSLVLLAHRRPSFLAGLLAAVIAGLVVGKAMTALAAAPRIDRERSLVVTAFVEEAEARRGGRTRLVLRPYAVEGRLSGPLPRRLTVSVRASAVPLVAGAAVTVTARVAPPSGPLVPGGYDFARVAWFEGVGGTGFALGAVRAATAGPPPMPLDLRAIVTLQGFRQRVADRIRSTVEGDAGAIAAALVVGERGSIGEAAEEAMRVSGLSHVLAISGLHMGLVTGVLYGLVRMLLAAVPRLALDWPIKSIAAGFGLAGALGYLVVSGMSVSTQRAAIMTALVLLAVILGRQALNLRLVAIAAAVIVTLDPQAVLEPGAQMSFAAVTALIASYEYFSARRRRRGGRRAAPAGVAGRVGRFAAGLALTSLIAGLATAPVAAFHFDRVAPLGLLANLMALPLVSFVVMPAGVAAALAMPFGLEAAPLLVMGWGIERMLDVAGAVAAATPAGGIVPHPSGTAVLLVMAGGLWLALWTRRPRLLGLAPLALGLAMLPFAAPPGILVSADGERALVMTSDGPRLLGRGSVFERTVWLRHVGSPLSPADRLLFRGVSCDDAACLLAGTAESPPVVLVRHAAAFAEECRPGAVVVTGLVAPRRCAVADVVIDAARLARAAAFDFTRGADGRWTATDRGGGAEGGARPWRGGS